MSEIEKFINQMGKMSQDNGDPFILGRIIGLLVVEGRELSLNQISERLAVSKASVSTNARRLAQREIITIRRHDGDRQDFYQLLPTLYHQMLGRLAERFQRDALVLSACVTGIQTEDAAAAGRVSELKDFMERSADLFRDWASVYANAVPRKDEDDGRT